MKPWRSHFLGLKQLPTDLSDIEITHFFTFEPGEQKAIRARHGDNLRLAFAVQLGFMKMTGRSLEAIDVLPQRLLEHLALHLEIEVPNIASLRALYSRRSTLFEHQQLAARTLNLQPFTQHRQLALLVELRREALATASPDGLLSHARQWLFENSILIPRDRVLRSVACRAMKEADEALSDVVNKAIPEDVRRRWAISVFGKHPTGATALQWLHQPPGKRSTNSIEAELNKIRFLRELGVHEYDLQEIPLKRQIELARRARQRQPAHLSRLRPQRRHLELVCLLRIRLLELTDEVLSMADMQVARVIRLAAENARRAEVRDARSIRSSLFEVRCLVDDLSIPPEQLRERIRAVLPDQDAGGSFAARVRQELAADARRTRPLLKSLVEVDFSEAQGGSMVKSLSKLKSFYTIGQVTLPRDATADFGPRWSEVLDDQDRKRAFRGYEAATLQVLRRSLKNGSVWTEHSLTHRSRDQVFIPRDTWERDRRRLYRRLGLRRRVDSHLTEIRDALDCGLHSLAEAVRAGEVTCADRDIHLRALKKEDEPRGLRRSQSLLFDAVGPVQLPSLVVEMDSLTRFSWCLLGRPPRSENELLATYGAVVAHGTGRAAAAVARMVPESKETDISSVMRAIEDPAVFKNANETVVDFMLAHAVTRVWGDGVLASSDAISLGASRHLWNARVDPKNRQYGLGQYTHLLDRRGIIYDTPVVLGKRQAGVALEGMMQQTVSPVLRRLALDTHGYTDFSMEVAKLLGFDFCPRLHHLRQRRLHVLKDTEVPTELEGVVVRDVSVNQIKPGWDGLIRVVASIEGGWTPASLALERFGSASSGDAVHRAGAALGKLNRTVYLCDYFTNLTFRRELLRMLNHGESVHVLQRRIHRGAIGAKRARLPDAAYALSGALTLLTNLVMAWTTHRLQAVLDAKELNVKVTEDHVRHTSPAHFENINLDGIFDFPLSRFAHRLFDGAHADSVSNRG